MADDIVTRLMNVTEMSWEGDEVTDPLCQEAADEIERLTKQRDEWQATAAGLSQDISNAEDEIERLRSKMEQWRNRAFSEKFERLKREDEIERLTDEINSLRLQVVALSIPKEARHG